MAIIVGDVTDLQHSPQPITFTPSCREYESISSVAGGGGGGAVLEEARKIFLKTASLSPK